MGEEMKQASGSNFKRKTRNESEKRRRDAFNKLIAELSTLVANGDQKMDKSNVLKCAISFLKERHLRAESTTDYADHDICPAIRKYFDCSTKDIVRLYIEALSVGTFCISCDGILRQASPIFAKLFNKSVQEIINENLSGFLDKDSVTKLDEALSSEVLQTASTSTCRQSTVFESVIKLKVRSLVDKKLILLIGRLKQLNLQQTVFSDSFSKDNKCLLQCLREKTSDEDRETTNNETALYFVGISRPLWDTFHNEVFNDSPNLISRKINSFTVTYGFDYRCLEIDKSCMLILGYSNFEMLGTSGYDYVHPNDLRSLSGQHIQLMHLGRLRLDCHRLKTKADDWLWVWCNAVVDSHHASPRIRCTYSLAVGTTKEKNGEFQPVRNYIDIHSDPCTPSISRVDEYLHIHSVPSTTSPCLNVISPTTTVQCGLPNTNPDLFNSSPVKNSNVEKAIHKKSGTSSHSMYASNNVRIVVEPLPIHQGKQRNSSGSASFASLQSPSGTDIATNSPVSLKSPILSPASSIASPRRKSHPLAYVEHFPLPEGHKISSEKSAPPVTIFSDVIFTPTLSESTTAIIQDSSLSISPMYKHVWEELQRRSEILRQQVMQKELELRDLHFKQFLASLRTNKQI